MTTKDARHSDHCFDKPNDTIYQPDKHDLFAVDGTVLSS